MLKLYSCLAGQATFPTHDSSVLPVTFAPAIVDSTSNGWATQPWPGVNEWPMASKIPKLVFGQVVTTASDGEDWLHSPWPGRGAWPYSRPRQSLLCQYTVQSNESVFYSQVEQFLAPGQTNYGSNSTEYCARDFCSSGVYVEEGWMFKSLFTQCVFYLKAEKELQAQVLVPTNTSKLLPSQYIVYFPVDNVDPFCQIYISTQPLYFTNSVLRGQFWAERTRIVPCQWKKRPF